MSLEFYPRGTIDFSSPGLAVPDAYNIAVHERISAAWLVSFDMPFDSVMREEFVPGAIVRTAGQLFIIGTVTEGISEGRPYSRFNGLHIFWEVCSKIHLPRTMWIGLPAYTLLEVAFGGIFYGGNEIKMFSPAELEERGLEAVTERTDIYRDRVTPIEVAARIRDHVGGEFYVDNFSFALVRRMGRDTDEVYNLNLQTSGIERMTDDGHTFTRLFPYGRSGLEITSVAGVNFIDSPHIGDDPEFPNGRQGQKEFADFTRPADLLRAAQWQFSPDNYWRIDRPRVTYSLSAVDLWKLNPESNLRPQMGDSVRLVDPNLGIDDNVRVVAMEVYPYEARATVYTLGDPPRTAGEILAAADPINQFFVHQHLTLDLDDLLEGILELLPDFQAAGIGAYFTLQDSLKTNFTALDVRNPDPPGLICRYQRIQDDTIEFIEATLHEYREPITERPSDWEGDFYPETWDDIREQLKSTTGEPVYFVVPRTQSTPNTRMTLIDPVIFAPPTYPPNATPQQINNINAAHRLDYTVFMRRTLYEKVISRVFSDGSSMGVDYVAQVPYGYDTESGDYTIHAGTNISLLLKDDGCWYFSMAARRMVRLDDLFFEGKGGVFPFVNNPSPEELERLPHLAYVPIYDPWDTVVTSENARLYPVARGFVVTRTDGLIIPPAELFPIAFAVNNATQNGITATATVSPSGPQAQGTTINIIVTLTGTAVASRIHAIKVSSANVGISPRGATSRLFIRGEVGEGVSVSFSFTMPSHAVMDLVVAHMVKIDNTSRIIPLEMTSNSSPAPLQATSSSTYSPAFEPWRAFDGIVSIASWRMDGWASLNGTFPPPNYVGHEWLQLDFGVPTLVRFYNIWGRSWNGRPPEEFPPRDWTVSGSDDGNVWTVIDSVTNAPAIFSATMRTYTLNSPATFRYYRITITRVYAFRKLSPDRGLVLIGEWEFGR